MVEKLGSKDMRGSVHLKLYMPQHILPLKKRTSVIKMKGLEDQSNMKIIHQSVGRLSALAQLSSTEHFSLTNTYKRDFFKGK